MGRNKSVFLPDWYVKSLEQVDFGELYRRGIRLVLLDIDNTLAKHGSLVGGEYAKEQIDRIQKIGIECMIISNAMHARAETFAESLHIAFIPRARKPSRKGIFLALKQHPALDKTGIAIIGDQILTDILAGNRAGIFTILLDPISNEEALQVRMKRPFERHLKKLFHISRKDN